MTEIISRDTHAVVKTADNGLIINNEGKLLIQNKTNGNLLYVPITTELSEVFNIHFTEEDQEETAGDVDDQDGHNNNEDKLWNREAVLFLIHQVEEMREQLDKGLKKNVWIKIASAYTEKFGRVVTSGQVNSKWKGLMRTYKSILLHNKTTGKERRHWEFFNIIHHFMHEKPEIAPEATCSSISGLTTPSSSSQQETTHSDSSSSFESSFLKKRKKRENEATKRHNEKMARLDKFNSLFEKMIDKM